MLARTYSDAALSLVTCCSVVHFCFIRHGQGCEVFLLPSGRFPRLAIASALGLAALLVLDLELVQSASSKLLASNALDFMMVLFAAACSFYAARRSHGYARQIWLLVATAFTLETLGQGISTYYQSFVPGAEIGRASCRERV